MLLVCLCSDVVTYIENIREVVATVIERSYSKIALNKVLSSLGVSDAAELMRRMSYDDVIMSRILIPWLEC